MAAGAEIPTASTLAGKPAKEVTATELGLVLRNHPDKQFIFSLAMTLLCATYAPEALLADPAEIRSLQHKPLSRRGAEVLTRQIKHLLNPGDSNPERRAILNVLCLHLDVILDPETSDLYPLIAELYAPRLTPAEDIEHFLRIHFASSGKTRWEGVKTKIQEYYPDQSEKSLERLELLSQQFHKKLHWHDFKMVNHFLLLMIAIVGTLYLVQRQLAADSAWLSFVNRLMWNIQAVTLALLPVIALQVPSFNTRLTAPQEARYETHHNLVRNLSDCFHFADPVPRSKAPAVPGIPVDTEKASMPSIEPVIPRPVQPDGETEERRAWSIASTDPQMQAKIAERRAAAKAAKQSAALARQTAEAAVARPDALPVDAPLTLPLIRLRIDGVGRECPLVGVEHAPLLQQLQREKTLENAAWVKSPIVVRFPLRYSGGGGPSREDFIIIPRQIWDEMRADGRNAQFAFLELILNARAEARSSYDLEPIGPNRTDVHTFKGGGGNRLCAPDNTTRDNTRVGHWAFFFGNYHGRDGGVHHLSGTERVPSFEFE